MAVTQIPLPTLYAEFSSDELGRTDLAWILYDKNKVDVTSTATITADAGYASGSQTLFPLHTTLPTSFIPGYLHVYFSGDSTIRPIDMDDSLVHAIILALQQLAVQTAPNGVGFQNMIISELGQSENTVFQAFLINVWGLWNSMYSTYPILVYNFAKRHAITYLLGNYWTKYDSKEKDITEFESQQFNNLIKLLAVVEKDILFFTSVFVGFVNPTVGELSARFPIEFIGSLYSPNSMLFRGYPSTMQSNPLQPSV